jgi:hypothetical protein
LKDPKMVRRLRGKEEEEEKTPAAQGA